MGAPRSCARACHRTNDPTTELTRDELQKRIDAIEESYEFFLAYAARGVSGEQSDDDVRQFLQRMDEALTDVANGFKSVAKQNASSSAKPLQAMIEVLERDAQTTQAAVRLVLARSSIGSQLIDNLNASIHVRAMLTDLFLLDEATKKSDA